MRQLVVVGGLLAGCGRIGFDVDGDARPGPDADLAKVCGPAYKPVAGLTSRYRLETSTRRWQEAESDCESDGGHLVVVDDAVEQAWIDDKAFGWIGLSDHVVEGTFRTVTGVQLSYTNFKGDEPNNSGGNEDCVEIRTDRLWNDAPCGLVQEFVCECDGARMPSPPLWCQTNQADSCGTCGTVCAPGLQCLPDQTCGMGGGA